MAALDIWVEQDAPPSTQGLLHRKTNEEGETVMTRPLCAYPAYSRYRGDGDPADAGSFVCTDPAIQSTSGSNENLPDTNNKEESTT
jgi:feruloyl esterase